MINYKCEEHLQLYPLTKSKILIVSVYNMLKIGGCNSMVEHFWVHQKRAYGMCKQAIYLLLFTSSIIFLSFYLHLLPHNYYKCEERI